jgi:dTDP-4-amino-4,6-dideoxygalactose transaminase
MKNAPPSLLQAPVYVTRPTLPSLENYERHVREIWTSRKLSNHGPKHDLLEQRLGSLLRATNLKLFCNGTLALTLAIKALDIQGEVLTTPFTFPATTHSIVLAGAQPVFCDISSDTLCIDPASIESMIGPNTEAILGVHVYGMPCAVEEIDAIAAKNGLKVIYDAAHAFMTSIAEKPISDFGDATMFSFHATKLFHTIEGGCVVFRDAAITRKLELLRNFGIEDEDNVSCIGTNAKMNEFQAAMGIEMLSVLDEERSSRHAIKQRYVEILADAPGITCLAPPGDVTDSMQYFAIRVNASGDGIGRDALHLALQRWNVFTRRYFYPLCSDFPIYANVPRADLSASKLAAKEVLCLPLYGDLGLDTVTHIAEVIRYLQSSIEYQQTAV